LNTLVTDKAAGQKQVAEKMSDKASSEEETRIQQNVHDQDVKDESDAE